MLRILNFNYNSFINMAKTHKRDRILSLQNQQQLRWKTQQTHLSHPDPLKPKYFITFPYPYMNGTLHLGHVFTLSKCDFIARAKRLQGFNAFFPFAFHVTGMPICAAAQKLKNQFHTYGCPPVFTPQAIQKAKKQKKEFQYNIMLSLGVPAEQIQAFKDPVHWVRFFPQKCKQDLTKLGVSVDFRRSFYTTQLNPYYDSFIRWQFKHLKQSGCIKFGKRPSVFSPKQDQICADHDRSQGEGVTPQEYTLIKIKLLQFPGKLKALQGRAVFLVAATLRPQTMYGQTNLYILPTGKYGAYQMKGQEIFICSQRAALNLAYQELSKQPKKITKLLELEGTELLGLPLKAPYSKYQRVYSLPMMTISMSKGTGLVTSVPSDSPDDFAALNDLKNKKALREKFNISDQMVNYQPIEIIDTPELGKLAAIKVFNDLKIKGQNDKELLAKAKDLCYLKGFYQGVLLVGPHAGKKVQHAKQLVKQDMITEGLAVIYYQPESKVTSRFGEECVVALCDQWYLNYADEKWKQTVRHHLTTTFKANTQIVHQMFLKTVDWIHEWGCSRSFGLGTRLPWDPQYVIQSLSDSTIYFAFYTISHYLSGDLGGSEPGLAGMKAQEFTYQIWDFIFFGKELKHDKLEVLQTMRNQFLYWYPLDLRVSGKDLIKNHLTMSLFNHAAIWGQSMMPREFLCNGWMNINGEKMSKSTGNFMTCREAVESFGADATRLTCAQSGDSIDDANFTKDVANASILQIATLQNYIEEVIQKLPKMRVQSNEHTDFFDKIFDNQMAELANRTMQAYQHFRFREVVKQGWHQFFSIKDHYLLNCGQHGPRRDLILKYVRLQLIIISPICPHLGQRGLQSIKTHLSPQQCTLKFQHQTVSDSNLILAHDCIKKFLKNMRQQFEKCTKRKKGKKGKVEQKQEALFSEAWVIYTKHYFDFQKDVLTVLASCKFNHENQTKDDWKSLLKSESKQQISKMYAFGNYMLKEVKIVGTKCLSLQMTFDQAEVLKKVAGQIATQTRVKSVYFISLEEAIKKTDKVWQQICQNVTPGKSQIIFQ